MNLFEGPRRELRRIFHDGRAMFATLSEGELLLGDGRRLDPETTSHLPPVDPRLIVCIHMNYESRRLEFGLPMGTEPSYFLKPPTTVLGHGGVVRRPTGCELLNFEGEIAAVVGRPMRNVPVAEAWEYLAGFAPANDVGLHDYRETDAGSMFRVKGHDGFCPIGPGVVAGVDIRDQVLRPYRNGVVVQEGPVSEMLNGIDYLLADISRHVTLQPGDIVLTGTPAGSRPMAPGDVMEVEVTGIGRLRHTVAEAPAPAADVGFQPVASQMSKTVAFGGDFKALETGPGR